MTKETVTTKKTGEDVTGKIFPVAYVLFLILSIYYFVKGDYMSAASNLGIGLIFDPFNQNVKWQQRPFYQKFILLFHVVVAISIFIYAVFIKK